MNEIKRIRNKTGLSQSKFAKYFGVPVRSIQKWEIDQSSPPKYVLEMMERILKCEEEIAAKRCEIIPDTFKSLFWDYDVEKLDLDKNSGMIISRLYNLGGIEGRRWAHAHYSENTIKEAALTRRDFDPIVANYLQVIFNLKRTDMAFYKQSIFESHWEKRR